MNGRNPLHYAADYGHADVLEYLLSKGAKIDVRVEGGREVKRRIKEEEGASLFACVF